MATFYHILTSSFLHVFFLHIYIKFVKVNSGIRLSYRPELTIPPHLPHVHYRVDSNTFTMGTPMLESTPQSGTLDLVSVRQPYSGVNFD
jgi:hypothetical protein